MDGKYYKRNRKHQHVLGITNSLPIVVSEVKSLKNAKGGKNGKLRKRKQQTNILGLLFLFGITKIESIDTTGVKINLAV